MENSLRTGSEIWESRGRAWLRSEVILRTLNLVCQRKGPILRACEARLVGRGKSVEASASNSFVKEAGQEDTIYNGEFDPGSG